MLTPTTTIVNQKANEIELVARSESSSNDCKHSSSGACQKPTSDSALTIALAIVIPVVVVCLVLGYFLFRNYRKEKRESSEHDPDFDENGEATALPDFPFTKGYEIEDPFQNQKTDRYTYYKQEVSKSSASFAPTVQGKPYMEEFILPYQHQTGSKVSLDDYARQLGGFNNFGNVSRSSLNISGSRRPSMSNMPCERATSDSPQKSNLRSEVVNSQSPSKTVGNKEYVDIPNYSFSQAEFHDTEEHSDLESVSDSNSNSSEDHIGDVSEKMSVKYENDSNLMINSTFQNGNDSQKELYTQSLNETTTNDSYDTTQENFERIEPDIPMHAYTISNGDANYGNENNKDDDVHTIPGDASDSSSPFEDGLMHGMDANYDEDGDFNFSNRSELPQGNSTFSNPENEVVNDIENAAGNNEPTLQKNLKSPRISAFNLLKNDSDDEDQEKEITAEQEEEIQRMKSIYKVYFDRANSQKGENPNIDRNDGFKYDESNPLPKLDHDEEIRINKELKVDTSDKRLTNASSIYTELPVLNDNQQQYHQDPNQDSYEYDSQQQPMQQYYQQEDLPPLQQLPNASEIRKSTLQTYTDFHPRIKNSITSPNLRHPYNPMVDNRAWSSPVNSPAAQSQTSFLNSGSNHQAPNNAPPSATQLSRTSVVLLNPVTEITKARTFKPAGSLQGSGSSLPNSPTMGQSQFQQSFGSESELIPGNRKSDIRRMMNSNF